MVSLKESIISFETLLKILEQYPNDENLVKALKIVRSLKETNIEKYSNTPGEGKALEYRPLVEGISEYIADKKIPNLVSISIHKHTLLASRGMDPNDFFDVIMAIMINIPGVRELVFDKIIAKSLGLKVPKE